MMMLPFGLFDEYTFGVNNKYEKKKIEFMAKI
jgi:hypothetical protein